ncbi:hypothetical protein Aph02nite_31500 [Actinoplanes philippinensis]|uniref:Abortive infection protein n=1 Tax=Actinoplanes philippinensis TaxID=35752 RepID=A0A1I2E7L1_9ACTN|nr:hypothetical protein [Actinoplanes philippinensis]GIE77200.1 hypothetical protein Aph02nite_31500 [Actinoplanes philippinensis]SFE88964.1 hypothetical protein SAMN05421541_104255 [Actinoplanes philippinensis]
MRANGIAYNTGFLTPATPLDLDRVRRELTLIRDDLHCNAVHLVGGDPGRLEAAARIAAGLGLEVWFSPYPLGLTPDQIHSLFLDCADRAERLRATGAAVVLVTGVELTIMNRGFLEGDSLEDRIAQLFAGRVAEARARLGDFLREVVPAVRQRFHGPVTYAAIPFEDVDWDLFDIVTLELIRSAEVAGQFREAVRAVTAGAKPVAVTGFGTAAWRGAADVAPRSMEIVENDPVTGAPLRLDGHYERDEEGQAAYFRELLEIFDSEGVDSAFAYLFALDDFPHRPGGDPRDDLDLASPGIVKVLDGRTGDTYPGLPWEPKAAFAAIARHYAGGRPG